MSLKRILAVTAVTGMLAVTGCSSNLPERNQGNRNGQRVADAVNNRPDSYTGRTTRGGIFGRTTRGIGRTAREVTDNISGRYTRTPNRANTFARPHARIGSTNRYEMNRTDRGIPRSGVNRATRRAERRNINGIGVANEQTVPVFFNKKAEPQQQVPEAPQNVTPAPQVQ